MVTETMVQQQERYAVGRLSGVGVVVPTYNAEAYWPELQASLDRQRLDPANVLIVDSSSQDNTYSLATRSGYRVVSIRAEEFGHGRTRQMACDLLPHVEVLVYLTQDAVLPEADAIATLCQALDDPCVGAAYGRQAPRNKADAIERHARLFNYPERSHRMTFEARLQHGIKAAFCSNSFAVYRRSALLAVGGFPSEVILGEDSVVAARLLMAGWQVGYQADAVAIHSHPLRLRQEFSRYFDTGVHHARERWLLQTFGSATSEGKLFVTSELRYLLSQQPLLIPVSLVRTCNKLLAYRMGRMERFLPNALRRSLSGYPKFWGRKERTSDAVATSGTREARSATAHSHAGR